MENSTMVTNDGTYEISLKSEELTVALISSVDQAAWWIIRNLHIQLHLQSFACFLMDNDGMSIICSSVLIPSLNSLGVKDISICPEIWRAFVINIISSSGSVHYLAKSLAQQGISILHISTFESEVFLVQEKDIISACEVFRSLSFQSISLDQDVGSIRGRASLSVLPSTVILARLREDSLEVIRKCSEMMVNMALFDERYNRHAHTLSLGPSFLGDEKTEPSPPTRMTTTKKNKKGTPQPHLWGMWRIDREITFLLDQADLPVLVGLGCPLTIAPQRWKVIRLAMDGGEGGREGIDFNQTGIVAHMSSISSPMGTTESDSGISESTHLISELSRHDTSLSLRASEFTCRSSFFGGGSERDGEREIINSLNISTTFSNSTLVPEDQVVPALKSLSARLGCSVEGEEGLSLLGKY